MAAIRLGMDGKTLMESSYLMFEGETELPIEAGDLAAMLGSLTAPFRNTFRSSDTR
jgi:hypothetical protein